jgi:hypothetical protein
MTRCARCGQVELTALFKGDQLCPTCVGDCVIEESMGVTTPREQWMGVS